nr:ParB N-terminal domain-containing protein [Streptomyces canus]
MAHNEFDDFFGDDDTAPVTDTRADGRLYRVPLARVAPNLVNPRTDFGTEDQLIDLGKSLARRQNQPCPVVSRGAYLKLWPEHADRVKDVDYVLVSGERRYRAATTVGLPALDCVANDDFAADRRTFMEAVVSENVDRQNFDPVEEAYAVQSLVREFGSNRAVAQHFERVDGWVTQRILLTNLAPPMQDLVRAKEMPLEAARRLGKLARDNAWDAGQQTAWWREEQDRRAAAVQARAAAKTQPAPVPQAATRTPELAPQAAPPDPGPAETSSPASSFTAVKLETPPPVSEADPSAYAPPPRQTLEQHHVPEQRPEPTPEPIPEGRKLPYDDGVNIARHLILKMPEDEFVAMLRVMNQHAAERGLEVGTRPSP